jgi:IS1 family transposase
VRAYTELTADVLDIPENEILMDECGESELFEFVPDDDLLMREVYSRERGLRVEFLGIQLDEMWSFVGNKKNKQWVWLALNPVNRQIIGFHVGGRGSQDAQLFHDGISGFFRENASFFSDYWQSYVKVFAEDTHFGVGKDSGLTAYIERFNCTLRQRCSRLVRKSLSFSKSIDNHINAIKYFICAYNLEIKTLHL